MPGARDLGVRPVCAVSIDVDPLPCYYTIHGLGEPPAALRDVIVDKGLPRFAEVLAEHQVAATFFVVAEDLDSTRGSGANIARSRYRELAEAGHELGNHSYGHPYDLARWPADRAADEIRRAHELIAEFSTAPRGFRAPGYDLSPAMMAELESLGYLYDSSMFPAPGYYAAKAAVMTGLRFFGRKSGAVLTNPKALTAPIRPYRPDARAPWQRGQSTVVEIPIGVTPFTRIPAIGTSLLLAPPWLRRRLVTAMSRLPVFNFELHGIDLIDADEDLVPAALVSRQPDLRRPLADKRAALADTLELIGEHFDIARLDQVAQATADKH